MAFKEYQSRPVTRLAHEVKFGENIEKTGEATYLITIEGEPVEFKAYEEVRAGDYVVYLKGSDIYHCRRDVFHERNVVEE